MPSQPASRPSSKPRSKGARSKERGPKLIGDSRAFQRTLDELDRAAPSGASVVLYGETGTGKSKLAERLHAMSGRGGPFVAVNCATVVDTLAESTLFGHKAGAFTGASREHKGYIVVSSGGTLFLDEVADLAPPVQAKLLQVLEEGRLWPLGAEKPVKVDLRMVAATNRNLRAMVREGTFRADLLSRLEQIPIRVPSLRERGRDVILLARHVLEHHRALAGVPATRLTRKAERWLLAQTWPNNVRGLENLMVAAGVAARGRPIMDTLLEELARRRTEEALKPVPMVAVGCVVEPVPVVAPESVPVHASAPSQGRALVEELARRLGSVGPRDLVEAGMAERSAGRLLKAMVEDGVLEHNGRWGKAVRYRMVGRGR